MFEQLKIGRMAYCLIEDRREPLESITDERLCRLLEYWHGKRAGRPMPARTDIDPFELREHLGRLHLVDVDGPNIFRFRLYGSSVTNPDVMDMTGRTTQDYADTGFGAVVTRHYQMCVVEKAPVYHEVIGTLREAPYEFVRLIMPLSSDGTNVDMLFASPQPLRVSIELPSRVILP